VRVSARPPRSESGKRQEWKAKDMGLLTHRFAEVLLDFPPINARDTVVAAVSGGPDSLCLLDLLRERASADHFQLVVAHLNHGLRPEAEEEARFVGQLAAAWGLPVVIRKIDLNSVRRRERLSTQVAARQARYAFLEEVASERGAHWIALGHHADDQAETVLMRLLRGSGGHGLAGIPFMREGRFIRPLLPFTRSEIVRHLEERKIPFVQDSSNFDRKYMRNRIRHELLPLLESYNPRIRQTLCREAGLLREDDELLEEILKQSLSSLLIRSSDGLALSLEGLRGLHPALHGRVIRQAIQDCRGHLRGITEEHVRSVQRLIAGPVSRRRPLPGKIVVERGYDRLSFYRGNPPERSMADLSVSLSVPGEKTLPDFSLRISLEVIEPPGGGPALTREALFDLDRLSVPLVLRPWRPGDRIYPVGMEGSKKLQDFFVDEKVPRHQRNRIPVLASAERVLWIVGYRQDRRFSVGAATRRALRVRVMDLEPLEPRLRRAPL